MKICDHCRQPITRHDCHDPAVMRPVHKSCYAARLAVQKFVQSGEVRDLPYAVKTTLRGHR